MEATTKIWKKMNPVTIRIYDVNQHKVVIKFLDMYLCKSSTSDAIFSSVDLALSKYEYLEVTAFIALGVDNTSANFGKRKSLVFEVRNGMRM